MRTEKAILGVRVKSLLEAFPRAGSSVEDWGEVSRMCFGGVFCLFVFVLFFVWVFFGRVHGLQDLSSLTRDGTRAPCSGSAES